ncbi:MAG TPA: hypothetical protein PKM21_16405, partial [Anaerolineales bacterium]|nr:hypothetical protein [Anaerolineales bacterium]
MNKLLSIGSLLFRVSFALLLAFSLLAPMGSALAAQPQRPIEGDGGTAPNGVGLNAAPLLEENFDYGSAAGGLIALSGGLWVNHSGTANYLQYNPAAGLTMPSYASSGIGGGVPFTTSGDDENRSFVAQSSGNIYLAALINLTSAQTSGDYFLHLKDSGTGFRGRIYAKSAGSGVFNLGTSAAGTAGTINYSTDAFNTGVTYLVVVKYDITNDDSALYALSACTSTEPATPLVTSNGTSATVTISAAAIRQGTSTAAPAGTVDGIRVATNWADAVTCVAAPEPELSMTKTVSPATNVPLNGTVTYTVTLSNSGAGDAANLTLTDTLPAEVNFGSWINMPYGTARSGDEITWNGTLTATTDLDFVFTADHVGAYGDVVTNTAEYEYDTITDTAQAVFSVVDATSDVTFVYHDLEDVVLSSESVCIAGAFNSWSVNATPLTGDASGEVFTVTLNLATGSTYEYKYVLNCADWPTYSGDQLNTNNRSLTAAGDATQDDYRNVVVGWANLQAPSTLDAVAYQATAAVTGQVYINGVTNPAGEGRGIQAEVGFGDSATPAGWTWFPMTFDSQIGNNDLFTGVMTPTAVGVYSYTTRYDGNWGAGNPNAGWTYTDLNGTPFSVDQTGVMTVAAYDIGVTKTGPATNVFPGETFTYTIDVTNSGSTTAANVTITDTLPLGANYVSDDSGFTPTDTNGVLVWTIGDLAAGASLSFELTVTLDAEAPNGTLTNLVEVATDSDDFNPANDSDTWDVTNPLIPIHDVQYVANPATSDASPLLNQVVWVEGIVTAEPGEIDGIRTMFIEDPDGGPWSGLHIFRVGGFGVDIAEGDYVRVQGQVTEYFGQTELSLGAGTPSTPWSVEVLSHNNPLPGPELLLGSQLNDTDKATSEQWESVYVEFGPSVVTNISLGNGEWYLNDSTGNVRVDDYGKPDGDLTYIIPITQLGDEFAYVRGIPMYSFSNYKLEPRYDADIGLVIGTPSISKTGPDYVDPGEELTYTIKVENLLGYELTNLVITDVVPTENAAFARALDGGTESDGIVTWLISSLPYRGIVELQFVVTATGSMGTAITNDTYAVTATEYPTPTLGTAPVITVIGDYTPIYVIQGDGFRSDFKDQPVETVGVVTGFLKGNYSGGGTFNAFFIQDAVGDSN